MADYEETEKELDAIIKTGESYFNTLSFTRDALTFIEDENGTSERYGKSGFFTVPDIPALSCGLARPDSFSGEWINIGEETETPYYIIHFNPDGSFASLYDKEIGREWVDGDFNKLKIYTDTPGNYDAWDILPNYKDKQIAVNIQKPLSFVSADNECAVFATQLKTEKSTWKILIRLFRRSRGIEVENIVDWHEKHKLAKSDFSCAVLSRKVLCDTSAGFIERETHRNTTWQQSRFECCHHKWCDISETGGGIAIINDGKYGAGFDKNNISLSLLRATIRPDVPY